MQRWTTVSTTRRNSKTAATAMKVKLLLMVEAPRRPHCTSPTYNLVSAESSLNPSWGIFLTTTQMIAKRISCPKKTVSGGN